MITLCIGRMRQGKSTLGEFVALQSPTRVIIDPRKQFHTSPFIITDLETLYSLMDEQREVIIRPGLDGELIVDPVAEIMLDWIDDSRDAEGTERVCLLVDEANMLGMDGKPQEEMPYFNYLLRSAGDEDVNIVLTSHRIVDFHPAIRSLAHYICIFHTTHTSDLKTIAEKCGDEAAETISKLKPREVLIWDETIGTFRVETDPKKWFVNLNKVRKENLPHESREFQGFESGEDRSESEPN